MVLPKQRPASVDGKTYKILTGHGNLYVTVNWHEGRIFEVFAQVGKSGACEKAGVEGIARLASLALRSGIGADAIIRHLRGIQCDPIWTQVGNSKRSVQVMSVPDAVSKVLQLAEEDGFNGTADVSPAAADGVGEEGSSDDDGDDDPGMAVGVGAPAPGPRGPERPASAEARPPEEDRGR